MTAPRALALLCVLGAVILPLSWAAAQESATSLLPAPVAGLVSSLLPGVLPPPTAGTDQVPPKPLYAPPGFEAIAPGEKGPSLLFTYWEQQAMGNALRMRGLRIGDLRPGTPGQNENAPFGPFTPEGMGEEGAGSGEEAPPEPGVRELSLAGIVYLGKDDWRVFLNDTEIRPGELPKQAIAMRVAKDHVDIQWFDPYTNQIFPIRLRVGQRFNLDMRAFLPRT